MAAALLASHPDAKQYVSGKPSGDVLLDIMKRRGMEKSMTVMIGGRVDTDIKFAQNAGASILPCAHWRLYRGTSRNGHVLSPIALNLREGMLSKLNVNQINQFLYVL